VRAFYCDHFVLPLPEGHRFPMDKYARLRARVLSELTTTFASHYTATLSLEEALKVEAARAYSKKATGSKYLIVPSKR